MQTLPVHPLDLEPFLLGDAEDRLAVAASLDAACRDTGFLQVTGHGVPLDLCDRVLGAFAEFFDLPLAEKLAVVAADETANRGYTEPGKEGLAYSRGQETPTDLFEAFNVGGEETVGEYYDAHRSYFAPNLWPARPAGLRDTWSEYERAVDALAQSLLEVMALALGMPEGWFREQLHHPIITTRAINYERRAGSPDPIEGQMRMGAHTDYGVLTILLADDVPGLQVFTGGAWRDIPVPRGAFMCNIGDMLHRWTNDRWTSTLHRVVPPPASIDGPVRRRSLARFFDCPPDLVVETIPSCTGPGNPSNYEPVVAGEWLHQKLLGSRTLAQPDLPSDPRTAEAV